MRRWREKNRGKVRAKKREYYRSHKAAENQRAREYHHANAGRIRANKKKWKAENPGRCRALESRRRAAKLRATVSWADQDAIAAPYVESRRLTEATGVVHHVDHVVPLISDIVCGLHWEGNLQILPALENWRKRNLRWPDMP
jgi:hypothetical protein